MAGDTTVQNQTPVAPPPADTLSGGGAGATGSEGAQAAGGIAGAVAALGGSIAGGVITANNGANQRAALIEGTRAQIHAQQTERSMAMAVMSQQLGELESRQMIAASLGVGGAGQGTTTDTTQTDPNLSPDRPTGTPQNRNFA